MLHNNLSNLFKLTIIFFLIVIYINVFMFRGGQIFKDHVDLTVLSIFQKAVTFDHNLTHFS